jgi:hypothetical protein
MEISHGNAIGLVIGTAAAKSMCNPGSKSKTLRWVARVIPCDKHLRFDPAQIKDMG